MSWLVYRLSRARRRRAEKTATTRVGFKDLDASPNPRRSAGRSLGLSFPLEQSRCPAEVRKPSAVQGIDQDIGDPVMCLGFLQFQSTNGRLRYFGLFGNSVFFFEARAVRS
jgi:hypothetical protein